MHQFSLRSVAGIAAALACTSGAALAEPPQYKVTILGHVVPGDYAFPVPTAINEAGEIVGRYTSAGWTQEGFIWRPGEGTSALPSPDGLPYSIPAEINDDGVIVGTAGTDLIEYETESVAWKLEGGAHTLFPQLVSGRPTRAASINNPGEIIGSANDGSFNGYVAVRFENGQTEQIFPGVLTTAADINDAGQITGEESRGVYIWTPGDQDRFILPLAQDRLPYMWAREINSLGHVTGITTGPQVETDYTFLYTPQTGTILLPPVGRHNFPEGINSQGELVGSSRDTGMGDYAWRWTAEDGLIALSDLLVPEDSHYGVWYCGDINEAGQIVAVGYDISTDKSVGMLLTPVADCPADFNGDDAVNTLDVLAFLNAWSSQADGSDFNGDGAVNTQDVLAFLNAWTAGC